MILRVFKNASANNDVFKLSSYPLLSTERLKITKSRVY